jgi:phosphohistidine phosphatase
MADPQAEQTERFVWLVQHGQAEPKEENPDRPLTAEGRATVERVAAWAAQAGVEVGQIRHSGKLRAEQTAAIFAEKLGPSQGVTKYPGLGPNDDVRPKAEALADCPCSVMVVGHLPFLSRLAGAMVVGDAERQPVRFRQGGLVGLVREGEGWVIACVVPPEIVSDA